MDKKTVAVVCGTRQEFDTFCATRIKEVSAARMRQSANELVMDGVRYLNIFDVKQLTQIKIAELIEYGTAADRPDISDIRKAKASL